MTTSVATFAVNELTMSHNQPYSTAGLNQKLFGVLPRGCYRGFRLAVDPGVGDRTVLVESSTDYSDHLALYETGTGYSLTIRKQGGDFLIDLSPYASETVYIAIYGFYSVGSPTVAHVRAYTEAEYAAAPEQAELVILGTVAVPAAGNPVTSAMIFETSRTSAWQNKAVELQDWPQLLQNSAFAWGDLGGTYDGSAAHWRTATTVAASVINVAALDSFEGSQHLSFYYANTSAVTWSVGQVLQVPVTEGQRVRFEIYKKSIQAATAGTAFFQPLWTNAAGTAVPGSTSPVDISIADPDYVATDVIIEVPAGMTHLALVTFTAAGVKFAITAKDAIYLGRFQVWLEPQDIGDPAVETKPDALAASLTLHTFEETFANIGEDPHLYRKPYSGGQDVVIERRDRTYSAGSRAIGFQILGGLHQIGSELRYNDDQARMPRIETPWSSALASQYTLLHEGAERLGATGDARIFLMTDAASPGYAFVLNASWNGQWTQEDAAKASSKLVISSDGLAFYDKPAGQVGPWADGFWDGPKLHVNQTHSDLDLQPLRLGNSLFSAAADLIIPRLTMTRGDPALPAVHGRTLLAELPGHTASAGNHPVRIYRSTDFWAGSTLGDALEIATNCSWNGSAWASDVTADRSSLFALTATGWFSLVRAAGAGTWGDFAGVGGWAEFDHWYSGSTDPRVRLADKRIQITGTTTRSNPAYTTTPVGNALYASNIIKAWGSHTMDGAGGFTSVDGFNIGSLSFATGEIVVTFALAMASADYTVVYGWNDGQRLTDNGFVLHRVKTAAGFRLSWSSSDLPVGTLGSLDIGGMKVDWIVVGKQTT